MDKYYIFIFMGGVMIGIAGVYAIVTSLNSPTKRRRLVSHFHCLKGDHTPGPTMDVVGGMQRQRCVYCDKIVHESRRIR